MTTYRALDTKTVSATTTTVASLSDFGFDANNVVAARRAIVSTATNNVAVTWSGVDPTSTLGHTVTASADNRPATHLVITGPSLANLKLLGLGGTATVTVTLER